MPRINRVKKCRKAQGACGKCGVEIKAGDPYIHWAFRYGGRRVRCAKWECRPRRADLAQSKMGTVYAAQDAFSDGMTHTSADELKSAMETVEETVREVLEEYREADEAMGGHGGENAERADDLGSWEPDERDEDEETEEDWLDRINNDALEVVEECPL